MRDLKLQARNQRSRSRAWQGRVPMVKESPKTQAQFDLNKELGSEPTMPQAWLFLSGGEAIKQYTAPTPAVMEPSNTPWPDHEEGPSEVPPPLEEPGPKSGHPLTNPSQGQMDQIWWAITSVGSMQKCWRCSTGSGGKLWFSVARWHVHSCLTWELQQIQNPLPGSLAGSDILATSGTTGNSRMVGPSTYNTSTTSQKLPAFPCFLPTSG